MMRLDPLRTITLILTTAFLIGGCRADGEGSQFGNGGSAGSAGSGGTAQPDDASVGPDAPTLDVNTTGDGPEQETSVVEGGYEGGVDVNVETSCSDAPPPPAEIHTGVCTQLTDNECDGAHDPPNLQGHTIPNGAFGNGYDDDCDGMVDEGCACDASHDVGSTKDCYLMPSSWVDDASKLPVGWCALNSKGTVKCIHKGGPPEQPIREWDGECRGAQPPLGDDVCAPGDFNCDGVPLNPVGTDCACVFNPVECPLEPLKMNPFPSVADLTHKDQNNPFVDPAIPFIVDGYDWIDDAVEQQSTDWEWELTGGDCDNILPHPTFAMYQGPNAASAAKLGTQMDALGPNNNQHGFVTAPDNAQHQVFPAFSLSGDYVVKGKFKLQNKDYECTIKVQVRAPGIRAELCWDTVGNSGSNDVDLHFARLQGNDSCSTHGWFLECGSAPNSDDCYYNSSSGCSGGDPGWGYSDSHDEACHGWGSLRDSYDSCTNPRLDRDNISCAPAQTDPNGGGVFAGNFCGPENINFDNPNPGDKFMVGVQCYSCVNSNHPATHPHVNVYCNGERIFSAGYDPSQPPPHFPALTESGDDTNGSLWNAAFIEWGGNPSHPCTVNAVPSQVPNPTTDGSVQYCVEDGPQNQGGSDPWLFRSGGGLPTSPGVACWH